MKRVSYPDAVRGIGIILVVSIHVFAYLQPPSGTAWVPAWNMAILPAVAVFFLADGWLHAASVRAPMTWRQACHRIAASARRLMLPWIAFSVIYLAGRLAAEKYGLVHGASVVPAWPGGLPIALWRGAAAGQLYFLPALFIVRILTLALYPLVRGRPATAACLAVALIAIWRGPLAAMLHIPPEDPLMSAGFGLGFAAIGWALAEAEIGGIWPGAPALAVVVAGLAAWQLPEADAGYAGQVAFTLLLWVAARNLTGFAVHRWLAALGRRTMEVYLLHAPYPARVAVSVLAALHITGLAALAIGTAISILAALGTAWLLARLGLSWLWGGRNVRQAAPLARPVRGRGAAWWRGPERW